MKKGLLLVSVILASQVSFGQLTQSNEPGAGENSSMYTITDTSSVTLAGVLGVTGTGVTWDYSAVTMEATASGSVGVIDATTSPNSSDFPTSTKAISQGTIVQFFNSTTASRISQGFVFSDANLGEVVVVFDTDEATQLTYPFNYNSTNSDSYAGTAALPSPLPAATVTGNINSTIDGTGTLSLPGGTSVANVFRLVTKDTTSVDTGFLGVIEVIRTQLEYYDLSDQNLPIFVDAYISISGMGEQRQLLSKNYATVGLDKNSIKNVVLFPNPSTGEFTISGEFAKGNVEVLDIAGKVVYSSEVTAGSTIKLNTVTSGIYTVKLSANNKTSIQKLTIK